MVSVRVGDKTYFDETNGIMNSPSPLHKTVVPMTERLQPPFDIECEIYREWALILREYVKPNLIICGHTHKCEINRTGCDKDTYGQPCDVVIASEPGESFVDGGFIIEPNSVRVIFNDNYGNIVHDETLQLADENSLQIQ